MSEGGIARKVIVILNQETFLGKWYNSIEDSLKKNTPFNNYFNKLTSYRSSASQSGTHTRK